MDMHVFAAIIVVTSAVALILRWMYPDKLRTKESKTFSYELVKEVEKVEITLVSLTVFGVVGLVTTLIKIDGFLQAGFISGSTLGYFFSMRKLHSQKFPKPTKPEYSPGRLLIGEIGQVVWTVPPGFSYGLVEFNIGRHSVLCEAQSESDADEWIDTGRTILVVEAVEHRVVVKLLDEP